MNSSPFPIVRESVEMAVNTSFSFFRTVPPTAFTISSSRHTERLLDYFAVAEVKGGSTDDLVILMPLACHKHDIIGFRRPDAFKNGLAPVRGRARPAER